MHNRHLLPLWRHSANKERQVAQGLLSNYISAEIETNFKYSQLLTHLGDLLPIVIIEMKVEHVFPWSPCHLHSAAREVVVQAPKPFNGLAICPANFLFVVERILVVTVCFVCWEVKFRNQKFDWDVGHAKEWWIGESGGEFPRILACYVIWEDGLFNASHALQNTGNSKVQVDVADVCHISSKWNHIPLSLIQVNKSTWNGALMPTDSSSNSCNLKSCKPALWGKWDCLVIIAVRHLLYQVSFYLDIRERHSHLEAHEDQMPNTLHKLLGLQKSLHCSINTCQRDCGYFFLKEQAGNLCQSEQSAASSS